MIEVGDLNVLSQLAARVNADAGTAYQAFLSGGPCDGTVGERNRLKRRLGAERLADLLQDLQHENLVVLGDMNAFEFSDGYVDVLGTVAGEPTPSVHLVASSDDRWAHSLTNLVTTLPGHQRYSYVFDGSAQVLDHVLVNDAMLQRLTRFAHARVNADFPDASSAVPTVPDRFSDHDGPVAYFAAAADLTTTTDVPAAVTSGRAFSYEAMVTNAGPDAGRAVVVSTVLPTNAQCESVLAPAGWTCATTAGTLTCEAASLAAGATARFVVSLAASCAIEHGTGFSSSTTASSPTERESQRGDNGSADAGVFANPAPTIDGTAVDRSVLWPPNGKMVPVHVAYSVADNCGLVETRPAVRSNDAGGNEGHGGDPDWVVTGPHTLLLRAERSGQATAGRVYTITITATDSAGNTTTKELEVVVPHNR